MSNFCPDCGKVVKANKCPCGWVLDETRSFLCRCGKKREIGYECGICYEQRSLRDSTHDTILHKHRESIGIGRNTNESKKEYAARCREYTLKGAGMAKLIGGRA